MTAPCKNCPEREIGCHSMCDRYIRYAKQREKIRENRHGTKETAERHVELVHQAGSFPLRKLRKIHGRIFPERNEEKWVKER